MKETLQAAAGKAAATTAGDFSRDWITPLLAGLGVTFSGAEWIGGVLLAITGGIIAARFDTGFDTRHERQAFWLTILAAFLVAHLAGLLSHAIRPELPPQIAMVAGGFGSRFVIRFLLRGLYRFESRGDEAADRIFDRAFPGSDSSDDEKSAK
ncbi:hypothetical protein [Sulfitobacter dubius]|uniref:hypothetical protein n=1 Tax=Sulfitobacter dubius TaxID=218673 RepID=UPI0022AF438E|nr:hypothetical protein [Sulfitobacter dubius]MCZ4366611.1 hypothetical protein [Sulfitobacter dubius]